MRLASVILILLFLASCAPDGKLAAPAVVKNTGLELEETRKELEYVKEELKSREGEVNTLKDQLAVERTSFLKQIKEAVETKNGCYHDLGYWENLAKKAQALLTDEQKDKLDTFYAEPEDESGIYSDK
jgi:predicted nuclease with TOPRIM domain